jgi:ribosome-associated protein
VLMPEQRRYYDLEAFWSHGESRSFLASTPAES